jgi:hypothetical protein
MRYKNTVEAVYINLEELQQIVANMGTDGQIHAIDVDLAMDKLRHVYDLMISLKQEALHTVLAQKADRHDEISTMQEVKKEVTPTETEQKSEDKPEYIEPEDKAKSLKKAEPEKKPETEKTKAEIESRVRTTDGKKFLGETFIKEKPSFNEELSQKVSSSDVTSKLKSQPITSITSAIGLAEKFELIQNLFGGDKVKYERTIEVLNSAGNFNEAFDYLSSNFDWDMNNNIYAQRLLELIRRKLIVRKNEQ